jgi:signal transduction histidine kinase
MTIVLIAVTHCTYAQNVAVLTDDTQDISLSPYGYMSREDNGRYEINNDRLEVNYGFDQKRGWCKFHIRNTSNEPNWILMIQQSRVDTVALTVVHKSGTIEKFPVTGHFQTLSERSVRALPFAFNIRIETGEEIVCYLYTQREHGRHAAIANIQRRDYFESYQFGFVIAVGLVCGVILLASVIGLVLFLFVRGSVYIYYTLYALSFLTVILVDTGFAHSVIPWHSQQTILNSFTIIVYYWFGGLHVLFTVELLELGKWKNRLMYWFGVIFGYLLCFCSFVLFVPWLSTGMRDVLTITSYYYVFPVNAYILVSLLISIRKREPVVFLYMIGFFTTILVGTFLILSDFGILNFSNVNKDFFYLTPLTEVLCIVVGFGIQFSRNLKARYLAQLELNRTKDQIITIQEDERRRIAQDLHDDVGNSLAAVRNMIVQKKPSADVEKEIGNVIQAIRTISHNLIPVDFDEFSLRDIVAHLVSKFKDHPQVVIEFNCIGDARKMKAVKELVVYRIINELITNIMKHSKANRALIQLLYQHESLIVTAEDSGVGMTNTRNGDEGIGLKSIRLRATYIQASLNIESDDKGTLVILEIPYDND